MAYRTEKTIQDIIYSALRKVNGYSDGDQPDADKVQECLEALTDILDERENDGVRLFEREWRQKIFTDSSAIVGTDGKYYRCIRSYTSPNYVAWGSAVAKAVGDLVIPATYNGWYYIATVAGTTGAAEPTFPVIQDDTVVDGGVTWKCVPDMMPVTGKNYRTYWYNDQNLSAGDVYATNTAYNNQGDFNLQEDEVFILNAFLRYTDFDERPIEVNSSADWADIGLKWIKGVPETAYIDHTSKNTAVVRIDPIPQLTGPTGYIFWYEVLKRVNVSIAASDDSPYPDNWNHALVWMLVSEIQSEYSVPEKTMYYNDRRAKKAYLAAKKRDKPKLTSRRISSCYAPHSGSYSGNRYGGRRTR